MTKTSTDRRLGNAGLSVVALVGLLVCLNVGAVVLRWHESDAQPGLGFVLLGCSNPACPARDWTVVANVPASLCCESNGTNFALTVPATNECMFFMVRASNAAGLSPLP